MAREDQRVDPEMALQVDEALAGDIAELAALDRMQLLVAGEKPLDRVKPGAVAPVDRHPLVPVAQVGGQEFIAWHDPPASSMLRRHHRGELCRWTSSSKTPGSSTVRRRASSISPSPTAGSSRSGRSSATRPRFMIPAGASSAPG